MGPKSGVWVRVWVGVKAWSLGQSLGPESEVWVRVWGFRQSLFLEVRDGQSFGSEFAVWVRVLGKVWESASEFGSKFGARVWSLGQSLGPESGVSLPKPQAPTKLGNQTKLSLFGMLMNLMGCSKWIWAPNPKP